jgi:DNA-binding PadR family transcriptional regulator
MSVGGRKGLAAAPQIRTNLEFFVLTAVGAGLDSPYDLHTRADVSVGAAIPLLARLEKAGLLQGKEAARHSRQYSITPKGSKILREGWSELLDSVPTEFEAILRIAYIAAVMEPDAKAAKRFLKAAAEQRKQLASQRARKAESIGSAKDRNEFGHGHRWLRAVSDSFRLRAESGVLLRIATRKNLSKLLTASRP